MRCWKDIKRTKSVVVSLDIENKDNISKINVGDTVRVYYNGEIAESDPLQINRECETFSVNNVLEGLLW